MPSRQPHSASLAEVTSLSIALSLVGRRRSDQAHELAHIILDHGVRTLERVGTMQFLTCDVEQEEEAIWLGGCLLLPRPLLLRAAKEGRSSSEITERYEVSEPMALPTERERRHSTSRSRAGAATGKRCELVRFSALGQGRMSSEAELCVKCDAVRRL